MIETWKDPICDLAEEKLRNLGVEAILYDLDDTLIFTTELFVKCLMDYAEKISQETLLSAEEVLKVVVEIDSEEYKKLGVNPSRWNSVVKKAGDVFPEYSKALLDNVDLLLGIYTVVPRVRPGAVTLLQTMKNLGIKQGLVTHANAEWTKWKLDQLGLWDYFDCVLIADENGHKGVEDWRRAMSTLSVDPQHCLVLGDSLGGDIRPAHNLGARTMWIEGSWTASRVGDVPTETVKLGQISETLEALVRLG